MRPGTVRLSTFQRRTRSFDETFGVDLIEVLAAIREADDDPVMGEPDVALDLESVGYTRADVPVVIDNPFTAGTEAEARADEARELVRSVATVRIGCRVPRTRRGLHMSRLGDAVARSVLEPYPDLIAYARALAEAVRRTQHGGPTRVTMRARVPYVETVTIDTHQRKLSLEQLDLLASVRLDPALPGGERVDAGIRVSHMVACPCVQKVFRYARAVRRGAARPDAAEDPGFTHSQRCVTSVMVRGLREPLPAPRLLHALDTVLVRTMSTLPRGSELAAVYASHRTPQFIEDALREALWAVHGALAPAPFTRISGRSTSIESIHDFDLRAEASLTPEDARRCAEARADASAGARGVAHTPEMVR